MSQFDNVSIVKKANAYFDGKVTSRTVIFSDGSKKTLGIMMPGEYEFSTLESENSFLRESLESLSKREEQLIEILSTWNKKV